MLTMIYNESYSHASTSYSDFFTKLRSTPVVRLVATKPRDTSVPTWNPEIKVKGEKKKLNLDKKGKLGKNFLCKNTHQSNQGSSSAQ